MKMKLFEKITTLSIICLFFVNCDSSRQLKNGYVLEYMNGCEARIFHQKQNELRISLRRNPFNGCQKSSANSNDSFVAGNIEYYSVRDDWVTGYASTNCLDKEVESICEGFFLLDTNTNEVQEGMSEQEWKQKLANLGWQNPNLIELKKSKCFACSNYHALSH
jgi:hypothetical protein